MDRSCRENLSDKIPSTLLILSPESATILLWMRLVETAFCRLHLAHLGGYRYFGLSLCPYVGNLFLAPAATADTSAGDFFEAKVRTAYPANAISAAITKSDARSLTAMKVAPTIP